MFTATGNVVEQGMAYAAVRNSRDRLTGCSEQVSLAYNEVIEQIVVVLKDTDPISMRRCYTRIVEVLSTIQTHIVPDMTAVEFRQIRDDVNRLMGRLRTDCGADRQGMLLTQRFAAFVQAVEESYIAVEDMERGMTMAEQPTRIGLRLFRIACYLYFTSLVFFLLSSCTASVGVDRPGSAGVRLESIWSRFSLLADANNYAEYFEEAQQDANVLLVTDQQRQPPRSLMNRQMIVSGRAVRINETSLVSPLMSNTFALAFATRSISMGAFQKAGRYLGTSTLSNRYDDQATIRALGSALVRIKQTHAMLSYLPIGYEGTANYQRIRQIILNFGTVVDEASYSTFAQSRSRFFPETTWNLYTWTSHYKSAISNLNVERVLELNDAYLGAISTVDDDTLRAILIFQEIDETEFPGWGNGNLLASAAEQMALTAFGIGLVNAAANTTSNLLAGSSMQTAAGSLLAILAAGGGQYALQRLRR